MKKYIVLPVDVLLIKIFHGIVFLLEYAPILLGLIMVQTIAFYGKYILKASIRFKKLIS